MTGDALRAAREARGWARERLAREAGVALSTVRSIEQGHPPVRTATVARVARALEERKSA